MFIPESRVRGKHCRHPIAVMGVVDTFGPRQFKSLVVETDFIYKTKRISSQKKTSRSLLLTNICVL